MQFMEPVPTQGPIPRIAGLPSPFPTRHPRALMSPAWQHPHTPLQQTTLCLLWTEHLIFERSCRLPVSRSARCRLLTHIRLLSVSSRANMHYLRLSIRPLLGTWTLWSTHLQWVQLQAIIATVTWLQCLILWLIHHMEHNHALPFFFSVSFCLSFLFLVILILPHYILVGVFDCPCHFLFLESSPICPIFFCIWSILSIPWL